MVVTKDPFRRTIQFLNDFKFKFKPSVKVLMIVPNQTHESHGTKRFIVNYVPKIKHSHPNLQISVMRQNLYGPYIRVFYEDGSETLCDTSDKTDDQIMKNLNFVIGACQDDPKKSQETIYTPNFGYDCRYFCICQRPGQQMCPRFITTPRPCKQNTS